MPPLSLRPARTAALDEGPRRILILTSSLGSGHLAAARALECELQQRMPRADVRLLDFWSLMDRRVARVIRHAYLRLVQEHAELYDQAYGLDQGVWRRLFEAAQPPPPPLAELAVRLLEFAGEEVHSTMEPRTGERYLSDRLLFRQVCSSLPGQVRNSSTGPAWIRLALAKWCWLRLARRLESQLLAFAPQVVAATQMGPAALLASVKSRRGLAIPAVGVPTDFGIHDFWVQPGIDCYCVAHEAVINAERIRPGQVQVTGIPLMPAFRDPPSVQQARSALGLAQDLPVLLIPGGGLGLGVDETAAQLLQGVPDAQIVALTGDNAKARIALAPLVSRYPGRLHIRGWTDGMVTFLRAADLVVGKLGGLTVAETLACGRPLLATRSLRGQEGFNQRFLERQGAGWLVADDELVGRVRSLLGDPAELCRLQQRAAGLGRREGAAAVVTVLEALARSPRAAWKPA